MLVIRREALVFVSCHRDDRVVDFRFRHMIDRDDPGVSKFDEPADGLWPTGYKLVLVVQDQHSVVRDQSRRQMGQSSLGEAIKGDAGLAAAGWTKEKEPEPINGNCGAVNVDGCRTHVGVSTGRDSMKRAPVIRPVAGSITFSARKVPPWASAICRLIDRPRPEFCPKLSPSGRSV